MLEEFRTVAELLALAVTAGEGPVGALERVQRSSHSELSCERDHDLQASRRCYDVEDGDQLTVDPVQDPVVPSAHAVHAVQRRLQRLPTR